MANQPWRNRVIEALRRQRLPSAYIERMVDELTDHAADLCLEDSSMEAQQNIEARLGTPEQIAAAAKQEFNRRTFAGRHPIVTFVVGPLVTTFVTFVTVILLIIGGCELFDLLLGSVLSANDEANLPPSAFEVRLMQCMSGIVRFVPFVFSAWLFAQLGRRSGQHQWSIAACSIIVITALFFTSVVTPGTPAVTAETPASLGTWMMGFGWNLGLDQILQAALPATLAAWMLWQSRVSRPKLLAA